MPKQKACRFTDKTEEIRDYLQRCEERKWLVIRYPDGLWTVSDSWAGEIASGNTLREAYYSLVLELEKEDYDAQV